MRSRKSTLIMYAAFLGTLLVGLYVCGKQIMTATEQVVERQNQRYVEIDKVLGR